MSPVTPISAARPTVLEFFAGIGLARIGLERSGFKVAWSNDYEDDKRSLYEQHFGDAVHEHQFVLGDVGEISAESLPRGASVAWGSSPCTDLSLAGSRGGLRAGESNAFWHFVRLLDELGSDRPGVVVLENVVGLATTHGGDDLAAAIRAFNVLGYSVDVLTLDARRFLPQSRPRLFLVGAQKAPREEAEPNLHLRPEWLQAIYSDPTLNMHRAELPVPPELLLTGFGDYVETMDATDTRWWDEQKTAKFVDSLSKIQGNRISELMRSDSIKYRTAYRRTRNGIAVWEVRPDDISGCLRTARGGSSKQAVVQVGKGILRVRWMTPVEYAQLMGAGDYQLAGARNNQALFAFGDAVAVPVVEWLGANYLLPLVRGQLDHRTQLRSGTAG